MNQLLNFFCLAIIGLFFLPGIVTAGEDGWTHGSLFSAPDWLLDMYSDEDKQMSGGLDYFGYNATKPTEKPPTYKEYLKDGWGYIEAQNYADAKTSFEKAINLNQTSYDAWYGKGLALENLKRYLSAIESYNKAISNSKKAGDSWEVYAGLGRTYLATNQYEKSKEAFNSAITLYEKARAHNSDELSEIYSNLAQVLEKLGDTQGAKDALEKAGKQ